MTLSEWIILGETGVSSKTMWAAITGTIKGGDKGCGNLNVPYDRDDFSRCYEFWKGCNISKEQLDTVSKVLHWWKPFIDNWDKLVAMYENGDMMYDFISSLEEESKRLAGWVQIDESCWTKSVR